MTRLFSPHLLAALGFVAVVGKAAAQASEPFAVHEWGTFTCVSGSDGRLLSGLEVEEHALPPFVRDLSSPAPGMKGWPWRVQSVTVKMETPVLYFYSDVPRTVRVDVRFNGGSISQWYPERIEGEPRPAPNVTVDFARGYTGSIGWRVDLLAPERPLPFTAARAQETEWSRARVPTANRLRGHKGEIEGFVFYRGLGRFELPLRVTCDASARLQLENQGPHRIPFLCVYDRPAKSGSAVVWWQGALETGGTQEVLTAATGGAQSAERLRDQIFPAALQAAGLTADEATAMLATWRESYFERPGLRVFWIVPREFTDAVLPLDISPRPQTLERVLVGRTEVLYPSFESQLLRDFAADAGKSWEGDRYFRAYRERVSRLGGIVGVAPAGSKL